MAYRSGRIDGFGNNGLRWERIRANASAGDSDGDTASDGHALTHDGDASDRHVGSDSNHRVADFHPDPDNTTPHCYGHSHPYAGSNGPRLDSGGVGMSRLRVFATPVGE